MGADLCSCTPKCISWLLIWMSHLEVLNWFKEWFLFDCGSSSPGVFLAFSWRGKCNLVLLHDFFYLYCVFLRTIYEKNIEELRLESLDYFIAEKLRVSYFFWSVLGILILNTFFSFYWGSTYKLFILRVFLSIYGIVFTLFASKLQFS